MELGSAILWSTLRPFRCVIFYSKTQGWVACVQFVQGGGGRGDCGSILLLTAYCSILNYNNIINLGTTRVSLL